MKTEIYFDSKGNTLIGQIPWDTYKKFDSVLNKNGSSANGLHFSFENLEECERLLKRAYETCFLFKVSTLTAWKKLLPEIEIKNIES